jgi:two-component system, sensor histidine kinase and response regulator
MQCYRNVLVVEDDDAIRETVVDVLRDDGYSVTAATNGAEALELLARDPPPCVVLLDLMMPVMTGWELVDRMRASEALAQVPVVVTSAAADRPPPGVDRVLTKPLSLDALATVVGEFCSAAPEAPKVAGKADVLRELQRKNIELAELHRFRDEMAALIVHDMKSPLAAIHLSVQYALDPHVHDQNEKREALEDARTATARLTRLVNNLLDLVKLESGRFLPQRTFVSAESLLGPVFGPRKRAATARKLSFGISPFPDVRLKVDADLVVRALENILDNAFRYTPPGGRIEVDVAASEHSIQLRIGNSGPPIPAASRAALFEKFGQVSGDVGRMNLGLGLYFCRLVLEAHGGTIGVEETAALPTVFAMQLPL